jgi:hypothetical protein
MTDVRHSNTAIAHGGHPRHWRLRIALLVVGTILSIAMAILVLYWGGCAVASAPYAQSAALVGPQSPAEPGRSPGSQATRGNHGADKG